MPVAHFLVSVDVERTARVRQLEGLFELPPTRRSEQTWDVNLPIEGTDWHVGLVVGPPGSGKSTVARELFGDRLVTEHAWPEKRSILDGFPAGMGIKEITALLSSVGFSSPPSWLRPYRCLSTGERFRVTLARALAESPDLAVLDEFTSVVDRTVAQVGCAAVARAVRRSGKRLIAVSCHSDIIDWLQPDWLLEMPAATFTRRLLQRRPGITLEVCRVRSAAWELFKRHHYLDSSLHRCAACFLASWRGRPVAFTAALHFPHPTSPGWREHRTVCLPDYQGVGIGNALSEFVAGLYRSLGKPYRSTTSNPAMILHRARSPLWKLIRKPSLNHKQKRQTAVVGLEPTTAWDRLTASFEYVGPARPGEARSFGLF